MRAFWDQRADEDAFFFVDNRLAYGNPDLARFWADGERDLDTLLGALEVAVQPGHRVLEIGCGVGRLTRVLAGRAGSVQALLELDDLRAAVREGSMQIERLVGEGTQFCLVLTRRFPPGGPPDA
jgi:2-polyprenyl-3-methyl-5-hydroxy-6-metoxy-1,4-benzoquinol methylase